MIKDYMKIPTSGAISATDGAIAVFVNKKTIPLATTIREAIQNNYTIGQEAFLKNNFIGLCISAAEGVATDGRPRIVAGLVKFFLTPKGEIKDGRWDPETNRLMLRVRLLKDVKLDTSAWTFNDVTPGRRQFTINTIRAGGVTGEYVIGQRGEVNGDRFPNTEQGETIRVDWAVEGTDKAGTLDPSLVTSNATRINIAESAFAELKAPEYEGKTLTITVRGNFANMKKSAVIRYVAPEIRIDSAYVEYDSEDESVTGRLTGSHLKMLDGDTLNYSIEAGGMHTGAVTVTSSDATSVFFTIEGASADWVNKTMTLTLNSRGGVETDPMQTTACTAEVEES